MKTDRSQFDRFVLFKGLPESSVSFLVEKVSWVKFSNGSVVLRDKESSDGVFLIAEGAVIARTFSISGKEVNFVKLECGDIFGEFSAIDQGERSASIAAVADCMIGKMRSADFRSLILQDPGFALRFCEHLVAKNRQISQRLFEYAALSVSQRICKELLRLAEPGPHDALVIDLLPTHQYLANNLGTHREAVSRELSRLTAQGLLQAEGRRMLIPHPGNLKALTGD